MTVIKILNSPKATIIPCIHEESGCSGLFNTITNEFYPVKTTEFEYIQSTETQYIDTGVQPKGGHMKRLTERCCNGFIAKPYGVTEQQVLNRLAEYEDAEEQGLLVRLPCKVGDSFFAVRKFCDEYGELEEPVEHWDSDCYGCNLPCNGKLKVVERKFNSIHHIIANIKSIGDSIFLTREEAEKALEALEEV